MARRKAIIDGEKVFKLAAIACTDDEIADVIGVARSTLAVHRAEKEKSYRHPETGIPMTLDELMQAGKNQGRVSLRRSQYQAAMDGNISAQIWLGKNWLGQKDSPIEMTGAVQVESINLHALSVAELQELYRLRAKMEAASLPGAAAGEAETASGQVVDVKAIAGGE